MALRGKFETEQLRKNIKNQLQRLLMQLEDLEKFKDEFDSVEEWEEEKRETEAQLKEFKAFLDRSVSGDMTLVDEFSGIQLAIQESIAGAFKTPEIIRLFAAKEPSHLRSKLDQLQRDVKTKKISKKIYRNQTYEILLALQKLNAKLTDQEKKFVKEYESRGLSAATNMGKGAQLDNASSNILSSAKSQIAKATN